MCGCLRSAACDGRRTGRRSRSNTMEEHADSPSTDKPLVLCQDALDLSSAPVLGAVHAASEDAAGGGGGKGVAAHCGNPFGYELFDSEAVGEYRRNLLLRLQKEGAAEKLQHQLQHCEAQQ